MMFYASDQIAFSLLVNHEKLVYWVIPEVLLLLVWLLKICSAVPQVEDSLYFDMSLHYVYSVGVGIPVFVTIQLLIIYTINILQEVALNSVLFYVIVGGSCYVGLTIYYFGLMVICCIVQISSECSQILLKHLFRSIFTVVRYNFGTVSYLATFIFPRIHATFAMNDEQLKGLSESSPTSKFIMTHFSAYNYTTMYTIVNRTHFSESLKEMLRFMSHDVLGRHLYYSGPILRSSLMFLLSTNNLMLILLWAYGLDNPDFSLATWTMCLRITFMFSLAIGYLKATSDSQIIDLYRIMLREAAIEYDTCEVVFNLDYFDDFDSSDESADSNVDDDELL